MTWPITVEGLPSNIFPATFTDVYIRATGEKWATLGAIKEGGTMELEDFKVRDSMLRNRVLPAAKFTAKFEMLQSSITEIELLDSLSNGEIDVLFKLADAAAIPTAGAAVTIGWVKVTAAQIHCIKPTIKADGEPDQDQTIEIDMIGAILLTEKDALLKASIDDDEFGSTASSGDTFYAIGSYTATKNGGLPNLTHMKTCGISSLTLADAAGGTEQTIAPISDVKFSVEFLTKDWGTKRYRTGAVKFMISYNWMETDNASLLSLDTIPTLAINAVITMRNGQVWTLSNAMGIDTKFVNSGNPDSNRFTTFSHEGAITIANFDGVVA